MKRCWLILTVCALLIGSLACRFLSGPSSAGSSAAAEAIGDFSAKPDAIDDSFRDLDILIRDDPEAAAHEAQRQLRSSDPAVRFGALYALANTATTDEQLDALRAVLRSERINERVLAAEALLVRGDKEAIPILIAALESDQELEYSLPPRRAWEYARELLLQFTEQDFGLSSDETLETSSASKAAWAAWWDQNGGSVEWVPDEGLFR